jgi:hypothetical protein
MGYIGQMPQAPTALPGSEITSGDKPEHTGARADQLPELLRADARSVSISLPATTAPAAEATGEDEAGTDEP